MSITKGQASLLTSAYSAVRKSGFLSTGLGQRLFASSYNLYKRYLEDPFHHLIRQRPELLRGGHVLDAGANIGYTASLFARAVDPEFRVYAFEPEEFNFELLSRAARSPQARGRIVPIRAAVGAENGTIRLWRNQRHHADHRVLTDAFHDAGAAGDWVETPILSLDAFVETHGPLHPVRFIKIDVQGYEFPVCQGLERTLAANPEAVIALEYMPEAMRELGFDPEATLRWFEQRDYRAHSLARSGRVTPGIASFEASGYVDLLFARRPLASE